jgi:hypothetical protein
LKRQYISRRHSVLTPWAMPASPAAASNLSTYLSFTNYNVSSSSLYVLQVRFSCRKGLSENQVLSAREFPTCNYLVLVASPFICDHPAFKPLVRQPQQHRGHLTIVVFSLLNFKLARPRWSAACARSIGQSRVHGIPPSAQGVPWIFLPFL